MNEIQALFDKNFNNPFRDLEKWKIAVFLHVLTTWFTFLGAQSNAFKASNLEQGRRKVWESGSSVVGIICHYMVNVSGKIWKGQSPPSTHTMVPTALQEVVAAGGQGDISYPNVTYGKFMSWEKKNFTTWALLNPLCTFKKHGICSISDAIPWKGVLSTLNFTNVLL